MRFNPMRSLLKPKSKKSSTSRPRVRTLKPTFDVLEERRVLSATWWVGTYNANFPDIQSAVNAAANGDTIKVEPGTYTNTGFPAPAVTVNKSLTIYGGQQRDNTQAPGPSIVASDSVGFSLTTSNITVSNFTFQPQTSNNSAAVGIATDSGHSGYKISGNTFSGEIDGILLNTQLDSAAIPSSVTGNKFVNNGEGIYSNLATRNTTISSNTFSGDITASLLLNGSLVSTNVQILNNSIVNDAPILLVNATGSKINGNTVSNSNSAIVGASIYLGGVTTTQVDHNLLSAPTAIPPVNGIQVSSFDGSPSSGNDDISGNNITGPYLEGIFVVAANSNSISSNSIKGAVEDGIDLVNAATLNTISNNGISANGRDGILFNSSSGNTVSNNSVTGNTENGIQLIASNTILVSGNAATGNTLSGIVVEEFDRQYAPRQQRQLERQRWNRSGKERLERG